MGYKSGDWVAIDLFDEIDVFRYQIILCKFTGVRSCSILEYEIFTRIQNRAESDVQAS